MGLDVNKFFYTIDIQFYLSIKIMCVRLVNTHVSWFILLLMDIQDISVHDYYNEHCEEHSLNPGSSAHRCENYSEWYI